HCDQPRAQTAAMSVQDVAEHVVEVLIRAESLFSPPTGTEPSQFTAAIGDASEASRAIGVRTDELVGALAAAHHDMLDAVGRRLESDGATVYCLTHRVV